MIGFQVFVLILMFVFALGFLALLRSKPGTISRLGGAMILGVMVVLGAVVFDPDLSRRIAAVAGIGRGADIMIYLAIIFLLITCATLYLRMKRLQLMIVELTRSIALLEADSHLVR